MPLLAWMRGFRNAVKGERRGHPRRRILVPVRLLTEEREYHAALRNISTGGALLAGAGLPPAGTRVTLVRGRSEAAAEMVWNGIERAGLRFDTVDGEASLLAARTPAMPGGNAGKR